MTLMGRLVRFFDYLEGVGLYYDRRGDHIHEFGRWRYRWWAPMRWRYAVSYGAMFAAGFVAGRMTG